MQIKVTCAERSSTSMLDFKQDFTIPTAASRAEVQAIFARAADEAVRTGHPIIVGMAP